MFIRASLLCVTLSLLPTTIRAWSQQESPPNALRIMVEGEPLWSRSFIEALRRNNAKYDLRLEFAGEPDAQHDLRLIVSGGNGAVQCSDASADKILFPAQYYYSNIAALTPDGKLLFTVARSGSSAVEAVGYAATMTIRNLYSKSTLLGKPSTFNSDLPQEVVKPIEPAEAFKAPAQEPPSEPGVYYKAGVDWIRLTGSLVGVKTEGAGAGLLTFGFSGIRMVKVYGGAHAKAQVPELKPEFFVRGFPVSDEDIRLVRLEVKQDHREAQIASVNNLSAYSGYRANDIHKVEVSRISNGVYKITPASELRSGEYALVLYISALEPRDYEFGISSSKK